MESVAMNREFWRGKRIFLTGHTGFKGGWLALWLTDMGAEVHGYALTPPTEHNLFTVANMQARLSSSTIADIRDAAALAQAMQVAQPDIVLHLAAQPLVRYSYVAPVETYAVNVMGTVNLLEAVRQTPSVKAVVIIAHNLLQHTDGKQEKAAPRGRLLVLVASCGRPESDETQAVRRRRAMMTPMPSRLSALASPPKHPSSFFGLFVSASAWVVKERSRSESACGST